MCNKGGKQEVIIGEIITIELSNTLGRGYA